MNTAGVEVFSPVSHTLFDPKMVITANGGKPPLTYAAFCKLVDRLGAPPAPVADPPAMFPPAPAAAEASVPFPSGIPTTAALGYTACAELRVPFRGGETEALRRLDAHMARSAWVAAFEKPNTSPTDLIRPLAAQPAGPFAAAAAKAPALSTGELLTPSTTGLSPYLKFGCLSPRLFMQRLLAIERTAKAPTAPPVSLRGQLLWREFFSTVNYGTPNFERMRGNAMCRQIGWDADERLLAAWEAGRTGFPFIDAAMTQLRVQGWMHHLARHSVACFLTRGDLWQSWEEGARVFDRLLLDADPSLNVGNWMWLSCSAFFHQYFRVYSPVAFGRKYDKEGEYVRHFLPALRRMPAKYVYEPWKAPLSVQQAAGCIVGKDYPMPIIDHDIACKANIERMAKAFATNKALASTDDKASLASKKARTS
jgi:cryptochrome